MKLNLLPTHVSKEKSARAALLLSILIVIGSIFLAIGMFMKSSKDLEESKDGIAATRALAQEAKNTGDEADKVMAQSTVLLRNTALAQAMQQHNTVYPDLYDQIRGYIPNFYRVNNVSAQSDGPGQSTITMVGVLDTYQQYADLMLALLRIPKVVAVSRSGFNDTMQYVPAPTEGDQVGKPHKPNESPIPDDPLKRLDYFEAQGRTTGYTATGGFGSGTDGTKGAGPNSSLVTVTITMSGTDLQVPDPRATLNLNGNAPSSGGGGAGPNATGGNLPSSGQGQQKVGKFAGQSGPQAPPTNSPPPSSPGTRKGKKGAGDDTVVGD